MPCFTSIASTAMSAAKTFINWAFNVRFTTGRAYRPTRRAEIVEIIRQAEAQGNRVKWTGSLWSFMGNFVSRDVVIESDDITGLIPSTLILGELTLADPAILPSLAHVRGGTKVFNVNRLLHGLREASGGGGRDERGLECTGSARALPTLGGSGGQSIAGIMATGSHGGDVHLPPIADCVRAIHLIGPGGQEFWIERANGLTAGSAADTERELRGIVGDSGDAEAEMCGDVIVKKDDDLFRAALVSVGRMGFVYALVIQTVPAFKLQEDVLDTQLWETLRASLGAEGIRDFIAAKHYLAIHINPFRSGSGHDCKVRQRILVDCAIERGEPGDGDGDDDGNDFLNRLCSSQDLRGTILPLLIAALAAILVTIGVLAAAMAGLIAAAGAAAFIPIVGLAVAGALYAAAAVVAASIAAATAASIALTALIALVASGRLYGTQLAAAIANAAYPLGLKALVASVLTSLFDRLVQAGTKIDIGWKIMDTYNYQARNMCQVVDSTDFAFDVDNAVGASGYLAFIDDVFAIFDDLYNRNVPVATLLTLRYTRDTAALIGMSQFPITCHVEISPLQGFAGNAEFLRRVQAAAVVRDGIPHWGQLMDGYTGMDIRRLHGANFTAWRRSLTRLIREGGGRDFTFSNDFTSTYRLEPLSTAPVSAVRFSITVGDDSLNDHDHFRHGNSEAVARVTLLDGRIFETGLNRGAEWPRHTTHHREVALPPGTTWGEIAAVSIHHTAAGDSTNADNWTMNEIVIWSHLYDVEVREQYRERGNPVWQFRKNDHQVWRRSFE